MEAKVFALLVVAVLSFVAGARANVVTGTQFPFENCKQSSTTGLYSAYLDSYSLQKAGSTMCFRVKVQNQTVCRKAANFPRNATHCCDVGFNKFKFYPNQACRQAVKGATIQLAGQHKNISASVTYQTMSSFGNQFVMKLTNLNLSVQTAQNALICIYLQAPCPTMASWSHDPAQLEFNMYNAKGSDAYECCPAGTADVANYPFSQQAGR